jgi:hypothetical protein
MGMDILLMGQGRFWHTLSSLAVVVEVMPILMKMKRGFYWRVTTIRVLLLLLVVVVTFVVERCLLIQV